ncbi:DUF5694 domain-containing protein [Dysgonomonas massiliensis]|uniref:DUF5694 domain-containing protein n=1 Tax=Dysgonomonas massiliensis TaxID=2040292 RepID=UPI001C86BAA7|nr:DUF5694 domain-containing protein [Dysgonomonas massiliensis]
MKKIFIIVALSFFVFPMLAKQDSIPILTLGVFHFAFPNLDRQQIADNDQIDVLEPQYQQEIIQLVEQLANFQPTIIVIERQHKAQNKVDSLYKKYLKGEYELKRDEEQQIGFRLAKRMGIDKLYCVDEWGSHYDKIDKLFDNENSYEYIQFEKSFSQHPDSTMRFYSDNILKHSGIIAELVKLNEKDNIKKDMGNYLIGHFKYESHPYDYTGVDFETGRWFNRNLRIFRNIQRIKIKSSDRILVIYGSGHLNILNYLFECSPEYHLEDTNKYLLYK